MTDTTDRTACPTFELLATAYHEAGHAVGAILVTPRLPLESVTIVPREHDQGHAQFDDWHDLIPEDEGDEDDGAEIGDCERRYLEAEVVMVFMGGLAEGWLRTGDVTTPVRVGWGFDREDIICSGLDLCHEHLGSGPIAEYGYGAAWMATMRSRAVAFTERLDAFWMAVGLVAGALMREKTLNDSEVAALVRVARGGGSAG